MTKFLSAICSLSPRRIHLFAKEHVRARKKGPSKHAAKPQNRATVIQLLRRQPLVSFYLLAFAWTWAYVILFLIVFPVPDFFLRTTPGDLGPLIAAIAMAAVVAGRAGVKTLLAGMVQWRMHPGWYALALLGVPAAYTLSIALTPGAAASFHAPSLGAVLLYPAMYVVLGVIGGPLTEEPGWRGFALPRLQQRWGPLAGTLVVGFLWSAWHLPNYFRPDWSSVNGGPSFSGVAIFTVAALTMSVLISWAYNRTNASVLIAILIHASLNFSQGLTGDWFPAAKNNEVAPVIALVVIAAAIVVATRGRLGYPAAQAVPAAPAYSAP